jgi:acyl CoA:acetate/3-ketoacid CoA transferase beta subunit
VTAARQIVERVRRGGHKLVLAGIGQGFLAARLARFLLAHKHREIAVLVETGLYDLDCGPAASHFLLAWENIAGARRLADIEDVLGALACGAGADCLGVLGAAQIDRDGNLNSTRLADGTCLVGSGGASDVAASAAEVVAVVQTSPGKLVEKVDYVTSPGTRVHSVVTDLGVLERDGSSGLWRVAQLVPPAGATVVETLALLRSLCPWELVVSGQLPVAAPATEEELALLAALDPDGSGRARGGTRPAQSVLHPQTHAQR